MDKETPTYFADAVVNVSHVNGVFRLTFVEQETGDSLKPVVRLLVPAGQLGKILGGIGRAAEDIRKKLEADTSQKSEGLEKKQTRPPAKPSISKSRAKTAK